MHLRMTIKRNLRPDELELIEFLLAKAPEGEVLARNVPRRLVEEMSDGGMGSIRFSSDQVDRHYGKTIAEAEFDDRDGVLVSAALNVDQTGDLYELDMWKVDFSPLIRLPAADKIRPSSFRRLK